MAKLKYSLFELNGNVLFTIYEQDERFRKGKYEGCDEPSFTASNKVKIHSLHWPSIYIHQQSDTISVCLRGKDEDHDDVVFILNRSTLEHVGITPQDLIEKIDFALKEWAENWEGWEEELPCKDEIVGIWIKEV